MSEPSHVVHNGKKIYASEDILKELGFHSGKQVSRSSLDKIYFRLNVNDLLTMPEDWSLSVIGWSEDKGTWHCTLSGPHGDMAWATDCASAEAAILGAKEKAVAKNERGYG